MHGRGFSVCSLAAVLLLVLKQSDCSCIHSDVRLTGGLGDYEGNVQVCINAEWGYVCDNSWGSNDAQVVCRQLGYSTTDAVYMYGSYYGYGNGTIWMDYVRCTGSEMKLLDCPTDYSIGYIPFCDYQDIAGVICPSGGGNCTNGDIRLISSAKYSRSEGRVEVCSNNEWGTVCGNGWDGNDATVACKQPGYTRYSNYYSSSSAYGSGSGSIWLTDLACSSSDTSLFDCPHSTDTSSCTHSNDAGVRCYSIESSSCTHGDVTLWSAYESTPDNEGIPLVCKDGTRYPLYRNYIDCHSFELACKVAGYTGLDFHRGYNDGGQYYGYYYEDHYEFHCSGGSTYSSLWDCFYFFYNSDWRDSVGLRCYNNVTTTNTTSYCSVEGSIRLVDGETANEGRVEYCYNNEWAPMCRFYDGYIADLICIELGYNSVGSQLFADNRFGRSNIRSKFDYLSCSSGNTSLSQCKASIASYENCGRPHCYTHYGLRCYELPSDPECTDGDVRLVDGIIEQEGRPEVCVNGWWSQICDAGWSINDAYVMCYSLGYISGSANPTNHVNSVFGAGNGPIMWSNVDCTHFNKDIFDCAKSIYPHSGHCDNFNVAGVRCTEGCSDGDVRLVGGVSVNEGTVEVCYYELWGLISDDGWSDNEAIVVCRQLGYNDGDNTAVVGSYYGKPNKTIHLNNVTCSSLETNILSCTVHQLSLSDGKALLPTTDVAGVNCSLSNNVTTTSTNSPSTVTTVMPDGQTDVTMTPTGPSVTVMPPLNPSCVLPSVPCTSKGSVRLVTQNGEESNEVGMVEYCNGTYWTPLCGIDNKVATVICRQLGHTSYSWGSLLWYGGNQAATSSVQNITCNGDEGTVSDCTIIKLYSGCMDCSGYSLVGLRCYDMNTLCDDGSVRLVDGPSDNEGRVEVCVNGVWGSVCDSDWDTTDGLIVCQQLGYPKQEPTVYYNSHYGDGSFPVVYSNVDCKGWEDSISDCVKDDYLSYSCYPGHTAGLRCNGTIQEQSSALNTVAAIVGGSLGAVIVLVVIVVFVGIVLVIIFLKRSVVQRDCQVDDRVSKQRNPVYNKDTTNRNW